MPKYRVLDQLHISALGADSMGKGTVFAASKPVGDDLVKRGLVEAAGEDDPEPAAKVEAKAETAAPENKVIAAAPANKASKGKATAKKA